MRLNIIKIEGNQGDVPTCMNSRDIRWLLASAIRSFKSYLIGRNIC